MKLWHPNVDTSAGKFSPLVAAETELQVIALVEKWFSLMDVTVNSITCRLAEPVSSVDGKRYRVLVEAEGEAQE